jgi:hypothetical protein
MEGTLIMIIKNAQHLGCLLFPPFLAATPRDKYEHPCSVVRETEAWQGESETFPRSTVF